MGRGWLRGVVAPQPRVGGGGGTDATRVLVWRRGKRCRGKCDGDEVVEGFAHTIQRVIAAANADAVRWCLWLRGCVGLMLR